MDGVTSRLRGLAERVAGACVEVLRPDAVLLAGSVATGEADEHSDVDLILWLRRLPEPASVEGLCERLVATDVRWLAPPGDEGAVLQCRVDGVVVQLALTPIDRFEEDVERLVREPDPYLLKAFGGLHEGVPLHGAGLIEAWRTRAPYSDELRRAVVARHWRPSPLLRLHDSLAARDAELFRRQLLVEASLDLLAVVAAVNRDWLSTFQLKRARAHEARFERAPARLVDRLEALHVAEPLAAARELERLREETAAILGDQGLLPEGP